MDGTATTQAPRRELERLLEETELLLAHASGDARATASAPAPTREAAAAVTALRAAIDAGRPTAALEPDFYIARAAIADAARPATPTGLAAFHDGLAQAAYEELAWAGHALFAVLTVCFVAFSLLTRNLDVVDSFNRDIDRLSAQAAQFRQAATCAPIGGINYEVNLIKERALIAYNEAAMMSRWMSLFAFAVGPQYRVAVEFYSTDIVRVVNKETGAPECVSAPAVPSAPPAPPPPPCDALPEPPARANVDCNFVPVEQAARKAHWIYGSVLLPMLFGAYGATAKSRRRALSRLRDRTLTPQLARSFWLRIGLAAFAGAFLSQAIPAQLGDRLLLQLSPLVLAFLVGYKLPDLLAWIDGRFLPPPKR